MAKAAQDAGISVSGTKAELMQLMQAGKVFTKDVMPAFTKRVSEAAWKNNALAIALEKNLAPALQRVTNQTKLLQEAVYEAGAKDGMMYLAKQTQHLMDLGMTLSGFFGENLREGIFNIVTPIAILADSIDKLVNAYRELKKEVGETKVKKVPKDASFLQKIDTGLENTETILRKTLVKAPEMASRLLFPSPIDVFADIGWAIDNKQKLMPRPNIMGGSPMMALGQQLPRIVITPDSNGIIEYTATYVDEYNNNSVDAMVSFLDAD